MKSTNQPNNELNREMSKDWSYIVLPLNLYIIESMIEWCNKHPSDGRYYDNWVKTHNPFVEWFFEKEEDLVLFILTWSNNETNAKNLRTMGIPAQ